MKKERRPELYIPSLRKYLGVVLNELSDSTKRYRIEKIRKKLAAVFRQFFLF